MVENHYRKMRDDFDIQARSLRNSEYALRLHGRTDAADRAAAEAVIYEQRRDYVAKFCGESDDNT